MIIAKSIIGKTGEKYIEYFELGDLDECVTKPKQKEKVLLFLNRRGNKYCSVDMEHSIFTISDNDEIYSYSNIPELYKYDGKNLKTLLKDVR